MLGVCICLCTWLNSVAVSLLDRAGLHVGAGSVVVSVDSVVVSMGSVAVGVGSVVQCSEQARHDGGVGAVAQYNKQGQDIWRCGFCCTMQ